MGSIMSLQAWKRKLLIPATDLDWILRKKNSYHVCLHLFLGASVILINSLFHGPAYLHSGLGAGVGSGRHYCWFTYGCTMQAHLLDACCVHIRNSIKIVLRMCRSQKQQWFRVVGGLGRCRLQ